MKYEIKFTNQFKKDIKLAKKQNKNLKLSIEIMIYQETIREQENVTQNRIGFQYMKLEMMYSYLCFIDLAHIQSFLKNKTKKCFKKFTMNNQMDFDECVNDAENG